MYLPSPRHRAPLPPATANDRRAAVGRRIAEIILDAPPRVQHSLLRLLSSVKCGLETTGAQISTEPDQTPVADWQDLLEVFSGLRADADGAESVCTTADEKLRQRYNQLKSQHYQSLLMIEIMYELINAGHDFTTAPEVLEQSARTLRRELDADMYVCRLHRDDDTWELVAADTAMGGAMPILVRYMEESHPHHPVMLAVQNPDADKLFVLSNDLRSSERGGDSVDCTSYMQGYRSRLSFILRDAAGKAFGLIMLYDSREAYFRRFEEGFLGDCAKIVSLTVERRMEVGQDALSKAAGGMAHVGNNVLGIIKNHVEIVIDELVLFDRAFGLELPSAESMKHDPLYQEMGKALQIRKKIAYLRRALEGVERLRLAIERLGEAVHAPVIMPYIRGAEVLDLEPRADAEHS